MIFFKKPFLRNGFFNINRIILYFYKKIMFMIQSMTGFGKAQTENNDSIFSVNIRTLNSKQCDINIKMPSRYREKEYEIRKLSSQILKRGKIDILILSESTNGNSTYSIDTQKAESYHTELISLSQKMNIEPPSDWMSIILSIPDVISPSNKELEKEEWDLLLKTVNIALSECCDFRKNEGATLKEKLLEYAKTINEKLLLIPAFEEERISLQREKIKKELEKIPKKPDYNPLRFEEEMVYYLEKMDITEEKVRLAQHIKYFTQTLENTIENSIGKKLTFIAQEMGREINTLGAKSAHFNIQKIIVEMKDELEKIKEQVLNVM